ncbi:MAG: heme-binding protein [Gammaproteobacteria bacterium]|jgi:effector-binding domain-containing protein|nr:heme-binding protein [Gammaproteobacteria bacterium]
MTFKKNGVLILTTALALLITEQLIAVEEAAYTVIRQDGDIEIREYDAAIVAETVVDGEFEDAGNGAFRKLFKYIDGDNQSQGKIAMTAPVSQEKRSEKIAMTSPVGQQKSGKGWAVSFMMPASYTMDTIPQPTDPAVVIRQVPAHRAAVIRYSGFWSEEKYREHLEELKIWIDAEKQEVIGQPVWARYNAPFTPWFMRRNEILIPVM